MNRNLKNGLLLDVETTGFSPRDDEIIEVALSSFTYSGKTGEIIDIIAQDSFLREPISDTALRNYERAARVHGIPFEQVKGKTFSDRRIQEYFERTDTVFAHNASFDRSFLVQMYPEANNLDWFCTMRNVAWKDYGFENSKLLTLLKAHGITNSQTHRAMDDITYLMKLLKQKSPSGKLYLKEVISKGPMSKYQESICHSPQKNKGLTFDISRILRQVLDEAAASKEKNK